MITFVVIAIVGIALLLVTLLVLAPLKMSSINSRAEEKYELEQELKRLSQE